MPGFTLEEIETALANGHLWARMGGGRFWRLRRNGATKRWKREPSRFRIPVKAGLRSCGEVNEGSNVSRNRATASNFLISETGE